jgi:AcrR family transcriptional regulator
VELRRARIMDAMVLAAGELGFARTTVTAVCARAKVSRRTFLESFDSLEDCFLAVLDDGYRRVLDLIAQAFATHGSWLEGVRAALVALLCLFDSEPPLAQVLLVEASAAGTRARECRERRLAALTALIEDRWGAPAAGHPHPLVPTGVMASLLGVIHTHLVIRREEPLIVLLGPLMGLVSAPYLDQRGVAREIERASVLARELLVRREREQADALASGMGAGAGVEIPALLRDPRAHRARACLLHLSAHPGASNRDVARAVGIARDTHISTLLARLRHAELVVKHQGRPGAPNAWSPSAYGLRVARVLHADDATYQRAAQEPRVSAH